MGTVVLLLVFFVCTMAAISIERISVHELRADPSIFYRYLHSRSPLIIKGGVSSQTLLNFQLDSLNNRKLSPTNIFVRLIPSDSIDQRRSNFLAIHGNDDTREYGMKFGELINMLTSNGKRRPKSLDRRMCHNMHPKCNTNPDWENDNWYWRWSLPVDNREDKLGPQLDALIDHLPFFLNAANGTWAVSSTVMRGSSATNFYHPHFDCYPNLLQTFWGKKRLHLFDLKPLYVHHPSKFDLYHLNIKSIENIDFDMFPELLDRIYVAG